MIPFPPDKPTNVHLWRNRRPDVTGGDWVCALCGFVAGTNTSNAPDQCPGLHRSYGDATQTYAAPATKPAYATYCTNTKEDPLQSKSMPKKKTQRYKPPKTRGSKKREQKLQRRLQRLHTRRPR